MLTRLQVQGFKSLAELSVELPRLTILFGPNASGKSNLLEAVQMISRLGTSRTLSDAISGPIRGYPLEAFAFPSGGLPELFRRPTARFSLEADVRTSKDRFRYRVGVEIKPDSGSLGVWDEYLTVLGQRGEPKGKAVIDKIDNEFRVRRKSKPAHPRHEPVGLNHALLSDPRLGGDEYRSIQRCRSEFEGWRVYYLDPRVAMRSARAPAAVTDIGELGQDIAPLLYRLRAEQPKHFAAVKRTLQTLIPSVENLAVDLDERRGTLDIQVWQGGSPFSSRIISEGTLRVLALCTLAANPWERGLIAFEEPENGVHPRRLELIAQLLAALAIDQERQVIVTTHSPSFCNAVLHHARKQPDVAKEIVLLHVGRDGAHTKVTPFNAMGPLFEVAAIDEGLTATSEDGVFEGLLLRGLLDE